MTRNPSKLYKYHVANLRELEAALGNVARLARAAIASQDSERSLRTLLRLYSFLLGAWAECRLLKLMHEEFGLNQSQREGILQKPTQLEQWIALVDSAFRSHYAIPSAELNARTLQVTPSARRDALRNVLNNELCIIIEIRNKLAHGQWIYPFNSQGSEVDSNKFRLINQENLLSLEYKFALLGHLASAIHDLIVSQVTFERDFDNHFKKLSQVQINLKNRSYEKYAKSLINSRQKARVMRNVVNMTA
jgi:hypothetical protein